MLWLFAKIVQTVLVLWVLVSSSYEYSAFCSLYDVVSADQILPAEDG